MINWFPGHQLSASRSIARLLKLVDVVIEVRDARVPVSSSSPTLSIGNKPIVVVLNKADLANPNMSQRAVQMLGAQRTLLMSCGGVNKGRNISQLIPLLHSVTKTRNKEKGPLHAVVVGVPNTGKSSLINALRGKGQSARQGNTPGLTRTIDTFRVVIPSCDPVYVLDTPGVLAPASALNETAGKRLAIVGCVKNVAVTSEQVYMWLLDELRAMGKDISGLATDKIREKYGLQTDAAAAALVVKMFREGTLGKFTLDEID